MKFVLASQNVHKQRELQAVLAPYGVELLLQRDLGVPIDVDETGATFAENARLKADAALRATGLAAIADDSGLMVDALDGAPGVYSARYTGSHDDSDEARYRLLLKNLEGETARAARFVCAVCCAMPDGTLLTASGACEGEILTAPRGTGGFGYDPVFRPLGFDRSMAELSAEEKNAISHRGRALAQFQRELENYCHAHK